MTNEEFNEIFRKRTMTFVVRLLRFLEPIPFNTVTRVLTLQLTKAGTSVGANFRAFSRGRSNRRNFPKYVLLWKKQMKLNIGLMSFQ